jgi:hypothetical protein
MLKLIWDIYLFPWHSCLAPFPIRDEEAHLQERHLLGNLGVPLVNVLHNRSFGVEVIHAGILALGPLSGMGKGRPDKELEILDRCYRVCDVLSLLDFTLVAPFSQSLVRFVLGKVRFSGLFENAVLPKMVWAPLKADFRVSTSSTSPFTISIPCAMSA